jgi:NAD(P)-dependent dehydrogenase (short-subunit alcohol dehydrogenase family)
VTTATFHPDLFAGKVALVVGGTTGIGAGIADAFAGLGAVVTVTGATAAECSAARSSQSFRCRDAVALDVRDEPALARLVGDLPRLDVLVNCAGIIRRGAEHDVAVFEEVLAINLTGTMRACTLARGKLKAAGGAIVNIASVLSFVGGGLVPGYAASKGGVAQLTKSLAIAYAAEGIRVNALAPGWVATPFHPGAARGSATQCGNSRADAARPLGAAGRHRRRRRVPVLARCTLHHRRRAARRRRLSHHVRSQ